MIPLDGVSVQTTEREFINFEAFDHQAASNDLISADEPFFAINSSPTGSGKTLSWLKPALDEGVDTIAVFPTNALVTDQVETVISIAETHFEEHRIGIVEATSETIAGWRSEYGVHSKGEALAKRLEESFVRNETTILLTNPDTLVIVRKGMYHHRFVNSKFDRFEMVVLDEFHLADVKQRDTLLFLIDEMWELPASQSRTDRFYFLSATPEDDEDANRSLADRLNEEIGTDIHRLAANTKPTGAVRQENDWVAVMPEVNLELRESDTFRTADELLSEDQVDEFVTFCQNGQTVVMVDGVHEADEIHRKLLAETDLEVRRITGFNKGDVGSKIEHFDVLVSNSAVEVGLDFQPEQLVFSAHDAPTLVQRLGRLREIDREHPLPAWCFVPTSVRAAIQASLQDATTSSRISRETFGEAVNAAFRNECDLSSFSRRWGELEAFQHVMDRVEDVPGDSEREDVLEKGLERIQRHYYRPYDREFSEEDLRRLHKWTEHEILDELKSYRGSGLQLMVKDKTAAENTMKLYDAFYLLRWGKVAFYPTNEFEELLTDDEANYYDAYSRYATGFCTFDGKIPTDSDDDEYAGRSIALRAESSALHRMKNESDTQRTPSVVNGLGVHVDSGNTPPIEGLSHLREEMTEANRLCYVVPGHNTTVKATYGLDEFFFLYPLGEDSVAIGLDALYLHCLVRDRVESESLDWCWDG